MHTYMHKPVLDLENIPNQPASCWGSIKILLFEVIRSCHPSLVAVYMDKESWQERVSGQTGVPQKAQGFDHKNAFGLTGSK